MKANGNFVHQPDKFLNTRQAKRLNLSTMNGSGSNLFELCLTIKAE